MNIEKVRANEPLEIIHEPRKATRYAWVIVWVVFLASMAAPLNQNKVPPLMPVLMGAFRLDLGQAGLLMSVFAITGFLLALPAGIILQKLGPKKAGLIALTGLVGGAGLGATASQVNILLVSRVIEGLGMGLIAVVAPTVIAMWFPPEMQGAPLGIWATWVPFGGLIMFNLAPVLEAKAGWQSVWWFGAGFALFTMLLYGWLVKTPPVVYSTEATEAQTPTPNIFRVLANRDIWLLGLGFACFNLIFGSVATFYPTFLSEVRGYTLAQAGRIASLSSLAVLFSAPMTGWFSDRLGSRRVLLWTPYILLAVSLLLPFKVTGWQIVALMIFQGLMVGAIPMATFAAAPEVMKDARLAGLGLGVIMFGQNFGMLVGPVLFGRMVETLGWVVAGYWLIPLCLIAIVAGWLVHVR